MLFSKNKKCVNWRKKIQSSLHLDLKLGMSSDLRALCVAPGFDIIFVFLSNLGSSHKKQARSNVDSALAQPICNTFKRVDIFFSVLLKKNTT